MRKLFVVGFVMMFIVNPATAAFHWPWEALFQHHAPVIHRHQRQQEIVPPNCQQINEAVKTLDPNRLESALRSSNKKQRESIAQCQKAGG